MGGIGSGCWYRFDKKQTVDESLSLAVGDFQGRLFPGLSGSFTWTRYGGWESSIGYYITGSNPRIVTLHYCRNDFDHVEIPVHLQSTPAHFGGRRWWFTCPLEIDGVPCQRRVGKLHKPPTARYFGCRKCHNLTYRSSQEAHQRERLLGQLIGVDRGH